jgi:DNA-binding XRE family transcriptional regulator
MSDSRTKIIKKGMHISGKKLEDIASLGDTTHDYLKKSLSTKVSDNVYNTILKKYIDLGLYDGVNFRIKEYESIAELIIKIRKSTNYSQHEFSKLIGVSMRRMFDLEETGDIKISEANAIKEFCKKNQILIEKPYQLF